MIATNGKGTPVNPVLDRAPLLTIAENGKGAPIVISSLGAPFIVQGYYDPAAAALFARFTTPPSDARKVIINSLVMSLKAGGIWDNLDCLWLTAAADSQAACRNWKADQYNLTPVNAPVFTADRGFGPNSSSRLTTGYTPSVNAVNFKLNDGAFWLWSRTAAQSAAPDMGSILTSPNTRMTLRNTSDQFALRVSDGVTTSIASTDGSGMFGAQRRATNDVRGWRNGAQVGATVTNVPSVSLSPEEQWMLGANSGNYSSRQQAFGAYGSALVGKEAAFYTAILTYMQAVGAA